ncbi:MAG: peptide deformylase, partial [Clostridia bacterium]|nr:peptide deformylase [Clostridia bacterium]
MLLDLVLYPHPILKAVAEPVTVFDADLEKLAADMAETMYEGRGVGLAAPQIGKSIRMFIVDTSMPEEPHTLRVYINPEILLKDDPCVWNEGCLSVPGIYRDVPTYAHVKIKAQDVHGEWFEEEATELRAVALLHEYRHLDGGVFIDRL